MQPPHAAAHLVLALPHWLSPGVLRDCVTWRQLRSSESGAAAAAGGARPPSCNTRGDATSQGFTPPSPGCRAAEGKGEGKRQSRRLSLAMWHDASTAKAAWRRRRDAMLSASRVWQQAAATPPPAPACSTHLGQVDAVQELADVLRRDGNWGGAAAAGVHERAVATRTAAAAAITLKPRVAHAPSRGEAAHRADSAQSRADGPSSSPGTSGG